MSMHYYSISYYHKETDSFTVLLVLADGHFDATKKAEKELERWPGYTLHGVSWLDKSKLETGSPIFVGDVSGQPQFAARDEGAIKSAALDFVSFNLSSEGMPHVGSQAWLESRDRLKAALTQASATDESEGEKL